MREIRSRDLSGGGPKGPSLPGPVFGECQSAGRQQNVVGPVSVTEPEGTPPPLTGRLPPVGGMETVKLRPETRGLR